MNSPFQFIISFDDRIVPPFTHTWSKSYVSRIYSGGRFLVELLMDMIHRRTSFSLPLLDNCYSLRTKQAPFYSERVAISVASTDRWWSGSPSVIPPRDRIVVVHSGERLWHSLGVRVDRLGIIQLWLPFDYFRRFAEREMKFFERVDEIIKKARQRPLMIIFHKHHEQRLSTVLFNLCFTVLPASSSSNFSHSPLRSFLRIRYCCSSSRKNEISADRQSIGRRLTKVQGVFEYV